MRYNLDPLHNHTILYNLNLNYHHLTGRFTAQILVFTLLSKSYSILLHIAEVINASLMTAFVVILYKIITNDKDQIVSKKFIVFFGFFIVIFGLNNSISQMLSKTIGIQYLWGMTLISYLYYKFFTKNDFIPILSFISGIAIGLYNEAMSAIIFLMIFSYVLHQLIKKQPINKNLYFFIIPFLLGGIIMLTTPGSYVIAETRYHLSPFQLLVKDFWKFIFMIFTEFELSPLFILALGCVIKFENDKYRKIITCICLLLVWLTIYPFVFQFARRLSMVYMLFYFTVIAYYINNYAEKITTFFIKSYKLFCVVILIMVIIFLYIFGKYHYYENLRLVKLEYYRSIDQKHAVLKPIDFTGMRLIRTEPIDHDPNAYFNRLYATAYGFESVSLPPNSSK